MFHFRYLLLRRAGEARDRARSAHLVESPCHSSGGFERSTRPLFLRSGARSIDLLARAVGLSSAVSSCSERPFGRSPCCASRARSRRLLYFRDWTLSRPAESRATKTELQRASIGWLSCNGARSRRRSRRLERRLQLDMRRASLVWSSCRLVGARSECARMPDVELKARDAPLERRAGPRRPESRAALSRRRTVSRSQKRSSVEHGIIAVLGGRDERGESWATCYRGSSPRASRLSEVAAQTLRVPRRAAPAPALARRPAACTSCRGEASLRPSRRRGELVRREGALCESGAQSRSKAGRGARAEGRATAGRVGGGREGRAEGERREVAPRQA